jgi:glutaryl-CoA dehydrogenase
MQASDGPDLFGIDSQLTAEEKACRDAAREFADQECLPIIAGHFDQGSFPLQLIPRMAELGLFGLHVKGFGCVPRNETTYGLICQELGRADSGLRAMVSVQNSLVMFPIFAFGSEEQRRRWLPEMARGETIGCFGLSEPGYGSNPGGLQTQAVRDGEDFILNGRKLWITNAPIAQVALIWAKLNGDIRGFLVEAGTPGYQTTPIQRKYAYRTSPTGLIALNDCRVPGRSLLPGAQGLRSVFQCLNLARFGVACGAVGSAIACYREARAFALERKVFERAIASYQLVQDQLVRMLMEITKAQLVNYHLGRLMDSGAARPAQISLAKLNSVREAMTIARTARDILGARGILADHHVIRHLCDLEALSTLEGTASMHTLVIGQEVTGIPAFY